MLVSFFYECCLLLLAVAALPRFLYQLIFKGKYRKSLLARFGVGFPVINKDGRPLVWIHAVSLGETKAVTALVKKIASGVNHPIVVFSTTTETGYMESGKSIDADYHVYLPFDFRWVINPIIKRTRPDLLILCESDFWFNLLKSAKKNGANVVLVNGKISQTSLERFKKFRFFANDLFSFVDLFCVQSHLYGKRFEEIGVHNDKIVVTGNMKFDGNYAQLPKEQLKSWKQTLGIKSTDPILVIGSSHHPEESQLFEVLSNIWLTLPNLKVLLVPRHPERFNEVETLLQKKAVAYRRLSKRDDNNKPFQVILIDAMGLLRQCYQVADVAIVAGSYTQKVGGHNILEPCWYGVPVIFGPFMQAQPDLVNLMKEYGAGIQVELKDLQSQLIHLFQNDNYRKLLGDGGLRLSSVVKGATSKTYELISEKFFNKNYP